MNVLDFQKKKIAEDKICMITCYDYTFAKILAATTVDCILVGDSVAMTIHGYPNTLAATIDMMVVHTQAVRRGAPDKFIITDLPFLSYRKSLSHSISATQTIMQAGANAVKLECAAGNLKLIQYLVESGVPVMGHIGLTPQAMHVLGGFKVQGKNNDAAARLKMEALQLQDAGCFAIVLECVPMQLAKEITENLTVPTIGIGAGNGTDGQVLVIQDLLGLGSDYLPKFVKTFANGQLEAKRSIEQYNTEVRNKTFPSAQYAYAAMLG